MTRREITAGAEWASRDAARAETMRAERVEQDPVAQAELHRIQWEGQPTPWMAAIDTQPDPARVSVWRAKAERASSVIISTSAVEGVDFRRFKEAMERINRGKTTPRDEVEGMGRSWDDVERQVAEERAFFEAQGLTHPTPERES